MSYCCVKGCESRKRDGDDISFHRFPNSEPYNSLWLRSCGKGVWRPRSLHPKICSIHFEEHMLKKTKRGTFLVPGAVPTKFFHKSPEVKKEIEDTKHPKMIRNRVARTSTRHIEFISVCRICLKTDRKMFILENNLLFIYQNVTNIQIDPEDGLPKMLCWECKHRVITCNQFTTLARNSNHLLTVLPNFESNFILNKIKLMNTVQISNLVQKTYPPDYCDYNIIENIESVEIEANTEKQTEYIDILIDIKNEPIIEDKLNNKIESYQDKNEADKSDVSDLETTKSILTDKLTENKIKRVRRKRDQAPGDLHPDVFVTTNLTPEDYKKEIEQRKETDNYKLSPYKCEECYKGFLNEETYKSHMARHSDQYGSLVCGICRIHFLNAHALRSHKLSHLQRFNCKLCPFVTNLRYVAQLHYKYHKGTRYKCPNCDEDFGKKSTYLTHLRIKHPSDIVCQLCGFSFINDKGLDMHKRMKHPSEQHTISDSGPLCAECDIRFASEEALRQHYRVSERHKDSYLSQKKRMRRRKTERMLKGPVSCEHCDRELPNLMFYAWHLRKTHPEKYRPKYASMCKHMCEVCGKMFQCSAILQDHMTSHSITKQFQCPQCPKKFAQASLLATHERGHGDRQRYPCPHCGKSFSLQGNMRRHAATHTAGQNYECEMCGKVFKQRYLMQSHINYVHLKKPWPKRNRTRTSEKRNTSSLVTAESSTDLEIMEVTWEG